MRKALFAAAAVSGLLVSLAAAPAFVSEGGREGVDLIGQDAPRERNAVKRLRLRNLDRVAFCGQCTKNDDCGVGYKCAGPPECLECVKSP